MSAPRTVICPCCGEKFVTTNPSQKYLDPHHANRHRVNRCRRDKRERERAKDNPVTEAANRVAKTRAEHWALVSLSDRTNGEISAENRAKLSRAIANAKRRRDAAVEQAKAAGVVPDAPPRCRCSEEGKPIPARDGHKPACFKCARRLGVGR